MHRSIASLAAAPLALAVALSLSSCADATRSQPQATCGDGARNGAETDVDCGGGTCPPCAEGLACAAGRDCASGSCDRTCQAPSCTDQVKNGNETDVDCGGGACPACAAGAACAVAADCRSFACATTCQATASCVDATRDGLESGVDCGGLICGPCAEGQGCVRGRDCAGLPCVGGTCQAAAVTCGNGLRDGNETDVDCGGGCGACRDGLACVASADCRSGTCSAQACCSSQVSLAWDAPQTDVAGACAVGLAGFRLYYGTAPGTYDAHVDLPLGDPGLPCAVFATATSGCGDTMSCGHVLTLATAATYYFAVTAYDRAGTESTYSAEVSKQMYPCP